MRYYLVDENEEIVVDLTKTVKVDNLMYSFVFSDLKENKIQESQQVWVRQVAGKYYLSEDKVCWNKIPKQNLPESLLHVDRVFKLYRGYKPSGLSASDEGVLQTQMPGKVVKINVKKGEEVSKGQTLIILEAMKMENEIKSGIDGVVTDILVKEGQALEEGVTMMTLEAVD